MELEKPRSLNRLKHVYMVAKSGATMRQAKNTIQ